MKAPFFPTVLLAAAIAAGAKAAEATDAKPAPKDSIRALLLEDAKNLAAKTAPTTSTPAETKLDKPVDANTPAASPSTPATPTPAAKTDSAKSAKSAKADEPAKPVEPPTMLPQIEVSKSRITELDRQIQAQDKAIAREKQNTKPTELDKALNDSKVSSVLSVLGGDSADHRAAIAKERVGLMEDERDILEELKLAKTAKEKAELQKELDEIRAIRRDLEKNLR